MSEGAENASVGAAKNKGCGPGCLGILAVFAVLAFIGSVTGGDSGDDPETQKYGAESACKDWVKDQLKAPSTADFNDVTASGSGPWTVVGSVDAENSFGAKLRNRWTCTIRLEGDTYRGVATLLPN